MTLEINLVSTAKELRVLFDAAAYLKHNPDVLQSGMDPLEHYLLFGADDNRYPCPLFDGSWYRARYTDVAATGINPFLHYIRHGCTELRDPHPSFNAAYYVNAHPEALGNPLLYHLLAGIEKGWATEPFHDIDAFLPSKNAVMPAPAVEVDVIIPVYRGYAQTIRCIKSVLADTARPPGRILVIDDQSPEPRISNWLARLAKRGLIVLLRNNRNLGFVRSVNRGIAEAGSRDVVLLNSDTEVVDGWLERLTRAAYAAPDIATASPFSNNATICSYPNPVGGMLPDGMDIAGIDAACRAANSGRIVDLPTTVGFCMYIRRAVLDMVGKFDAKTFGRGYGEEVDFCRRAIALGWRHVLACDVFVYHEGAVSFGVNSPHAQRSEGILNARYPDYISDVTAFASLDPALPARFALTAALFQDNGLPGVVFIAHGKGGGVWRHMQDIMARFRSKLNFFLLEPDQRGVALSVPAIPDHPVFRFGPDRIEDLALYLKSAGVSRVHVHHTLDIPMDLPLFIRRIGLPFDLTVHDYFSICPQINFLPFLDAQYCNEPAARHCNACIAVTPNNGATDIDSWRWKHAWLFLDADRVICPSEDTRARLVRYGLGKAAIVAPHEPVHDKSWALAHTRIEAAAGMAAPLRVALLGVLADRKGLATVTAVADAAGEDIALHLIGHPENALEPRLAGRLAVSGAYNDADLPALIADLRPHVFWFPAQWPETYSYTLSAAINAGGAIVAVDLGAFPERLRDRPLTWLVPAGASAQTWLDAFAAARKALSATQKQAQKAMARPQILDFYAQDYLRPMITPVGPAHPAAAKALARRVLLIPERMATDAPSPCAYIRLLQPLHYPSVSAGLDIRVASVMSALDEAANTIVTHRHAVTDPDEITALTACCAARKIRLIYDLDDDLLGLPDDHPDAESLSSHTDAVQRMLAAASEIWVSTPALARRLGKHQSKVTIMPNGLDDRLWWPPPALDRPISGPLRLLYMGTGTHAADLALILPALERLQTAFGARVAIDIIGVTPFELPGWLNRIAVPNVATRGYPAFVNWLSQENKWHIGLAPLADTIFNRGKSAIKAMDYAALGLPTVGSDIGVYDSVINHGGNGLLVANREVDWFAALAGLVRDPGRRRNMALQARATFNARFTLAAQAAARRLALLGAIEQSPR